MAGKLVGNAIGEYITNLCRELGRSNLRRIAELRAEGQTPTEISNDYAAYLQYAMYLGASFVTCNPPLVDAAWVADPDYWNPIVDKIVQSNYEEDGDALARLVTLAVVLEHGRQFVLDRLAPARPRGDGRQTPMRGHPIFVAQHATATCCRGCLARWHGIPKGRPLADAEVEYVATTVAAAL